MTKLLADYFAKKGSEDPVADAVIVGALLDGISFQYIVEPDDFPLDKVEKRVISMFTK